MQLTTLIKVASPLSEGVKMWCLKLCCAKFDSAPIETGILILHRIFTSVYDVRFNPFNII